MVEPGVDLDRFRPAPSGSAAAGRLAARRRLGLPDYGYVVAFVGRIQPLKAPDVLLHAVAALRERDPRIAEQLTVVIAGGPSGTGLDRPTALIELAASLGIADSVRFRPPLHGRRPAGAVPGGGPGRGAVVHESFGLVALEAQACGTPVVAASVGGLVTAVRDGLSGILVDGHDPVDWARTLGGLLAAPGRRAALSAGAVRHAQNFSWTRTAAGLLAVYREAVAEHRSRLASELGGEPEVLPTTVLPAGVR